MPDTLLEDAGSGVKSPARAIRGLKFSSAAETNTTFGTSQPGQSRSQPFTGSTPHQPPPVTMLQSNYVRPGSGTGGSQANLFLPGANRKWAWHGFGAVGAALGCGLILSALHWYVGWYVAKIWLFAFALPIFGVQRGYLGLQYNRPLAVVVIGLNILSMLGVFVLVFRDFLF